MLKLLRARFIGRMKICGGEFFSMVLTTYTQISSFNMFYRSLHLRTSREISDDLHVSIQLCKWESIYKFRKILSRINFDIKLHFLFNKLKYKEKPSNINRNTKNLRARVFLKKKTWLHNVLFALHRSSSNNIHHRRWGYYTHCHIFSIT